MNEFKKSSVDWDEICKLPTPFAAAFACGNHRRMGALIKKISFSGSRVRIFVASGDNNLIYVFPIKKVDFFTVLIEKQNLTTLGG